MCLKTSCDKCQKTTWYGCGQHVPSVMDKIPHEHWCVCEPKVEKHGKHYPPASPNRPGCNVC